MNALNALGSQTPLLSGGSPAEPQIDQQADVREAFQDFVAGTFYKQMLKALRSTERKPAYLHGGKAEEIFQGQMDQQVAEDLARDHGADLIGPMYTTFAAHLRYKLQREGAAPASSPQDSPQIASSAAKIGK